MDIKKFLETVDKFDFAGEKIGQRPGEQWKGTDPNPPGKKLVGSGSAEESIVRELYKHVKETETERKLKRDFDDFDSEDWAEWDAKIKRLKQRAKQGELVTVWDKEKRVYKNVPKSEIKEYQNRQDPDAQVTSPPSPDASQTAIDQVQDKIFARDVEDETVEEQQANANDPEAQTFVDPYNVKLKTSAAAQQADPNKTGQAGDPTQQTFVQPFNAKYKPSAATQVVQAPPVQPKISVPSNVATGKVQNLGRTTFQSLAKLNPEIKDVNKIYPGQEIKLPDGSKTVVAKGDTLSGIAQRYRQATTQNKQVATLQPKKDFKKMPDYLLKQIPGVESSNNPKAIGAAGEIGSFQTLPSTLRKPGFGIKPAQDNSPEEAARVGRDYANAMYNRYRDPAKALAAYNAGPGAVDRAIRLAAAKGGDWKQYIPKSTRDSYLAKYNLTPSRRTAESLMTDFRKFVSEYGNQQAPDQQATSQDSAESDAEAELKRQRMDKRVSQATLAGLSAVLPPGTNTAVAATALNKIVDRKPLSPQENQVIGTLMPLLARAAEEPSTSASLKTALGRAGMLTKLGKQ